MKKVKLCVLLLGLFLSNASSSQNIQYEAVYSESDLQQREINQNLVVGKSPSSSSVSLTGAFNYSVPIRIPVGTKEMQPHIQINYSSQAGNGLLGLGWEIAGLSAISRVNLNHFHDNVVRNVKAQHDDAIALDGNRLVLLDGENLQSGSEYSTEKESFFKIKCHGQLGNGPKWFAVHTKEGLKLEYGRTPNSRIKDDNSATILSWKLSRTIDQHGNYIEYRYTNDGEAHFIKEIAYTGNINKEQMPYVRMVFEYANRLDASTRYAFEQGHAFRQNKLLKSIDVVYGEESRSYKAYEFKYGFDSYSVLNEIIEYGKEGSTEHYNSLRFNYWEIGEHYQEQQLSLVPGQADIFSGDFDGDGLDDIIRVPFFINGSNQKVHQDFWVYKNIGDQFQFSNTLAIGNQTQAGAGMNNNYLPFVGIIGIFPADYDGNGTVDIAIAYSGNNGQQLGKLTLDRIDVHHSLIGDAQFFQHQYSLQANAGQNFLGWRNALVVADFNADGAADIYVNTHNGFKGNGSHIDDWYYPQLFLPRISHTPLAVHGIDQFSNNKFSLNDQVHVLDMNGNGKAEIMQIFEHSEVNKTVVREYHVHDTYVSSEVLYEDNAGTTEYANFPSKGHRVEFGDFNADGKTDILSSSSANLIDWDIHLSTGRDFVFNSQHHYYASQFGEHLQVADFNGDQFSDILISTDKGSTSNLDLHTFHGIDPISNLLIQESQHEVFSDRIHGSKPLYLIEVDGDPGLEIMYFESNTQPLKFAHFTRGSQDGRLHYISTGFNELTEVKYRSLPEKNSCRGLYFQDSTAIYPLMDFGKGMIVCDELNIPDHSGDNNFSSRILQRYHYRNAKFHQQGKGFIGFGEIEYEQSHTAFDELPIQLFHDEYEVDLDHYFSRPLKSFQAHVTYDNTVSFPCHDARILDKNLMSMERKYTTISLDSHRFISQLYEVLKGNNVLGFTEEVSYEFAGNKSSIHANPSAIVTIRAKGNSAQEVERRELQYGKFDAHIASRITSERIIKTRGNKSPVEFLFERDYSGMGDLLSSIQKHPQTLQIVKENKFSYDPNFGLPLIEELIVPNHSISSRMNFMEYDDLGRFLIKQINPLGYEETWEFDDLSALAIRYNDLRPNNGIEQFEYNDFHQLILSIDQDGNKTVLTREFEIQQMNQADEPASTLYFEHKNKTGFGHEKKWFDHIGQLRKTEVSGFQQLIYSIADFDSRGSLVKESDAFFANNLKNLNTYEYDEFARLFRAHYSNSSNTILQTKTINHALHTGIVQPYNYTNREFETEEIRSDGFRTSSKVDASGKTVYTTDPAGDVSISYNSFGKVDSTFVNGALVSLVNYDDFGFKAGLEEMNSGKSKYQYNILGELLWQEDAQGRKIDQMTYDAMSRILSKNGAGNTFTYEYANSGNGIGQLIRAVNNANGIEESHVHDLNGRLMENTFRINGLDYSYSYQYNTKGQIIQQNYPDQAQLEYTYNGDGFLYKIEDRTTDPNKQLIYFEGLAQDELGKWISTNKLGGINQQITYDNYHQLDKILVPGIHERAFDFDPRNGNLRSRSDLIRQMTESFEYDAEDRLKKVKVNGQTSMSIAYDQIGNIKNKSDAGIYSYHPAKHHAIASIDNSPSNVQVSTQDIQYDAFQNPISIQEGNWEIDYQYGPFHKRRMATKRNVQTGAIATMVYTENVDLVLDQQGQTLLQMTYIQDDNAWCAIRVNEPASGLKESYALHLDHLGSIEVLTDDQGQIIAEQSFNAWGSKRDPNNWMNSAGLTPSWLKRGYTSHEQLDSFQLVHMNGRLYDPILARMLSVDNYVSDAGNSQAYNRYSYVMNNPLKYSDPTGELPVAPIIFGAVIGAYSGGAMMNGTRDVRNWNFQSGKTWGGMLAGASIGGLSGYIGAGIAGSGMAFANTSSILFSSYTYSSGFTLLSGGSHDPMIGFGVASFNLSTGELGYLGKKGNSILDNLGYGLGAMANLSDLAGMGPKGSVEFQSERLESNNERGFDIYGHAQIVDQDGKSLIDFGPGNGFFGFKKGRNNWIDYASKGRISQSIHIKENMHTQGIAVHGVNVKKIRRISHQLNYNPRYYNFMLRSCSSVAARALRRSGVPVFGGHPYLLRFQLKHNIRPYMFNYTYMNE